MDGVYKFENVDLIGHLCRTNTQSCVPMRALGQPAANLATETMLLHMCEQYEFDIDKV